MPSIISSSLSQRSAHDASVSRYRGLDASYNVMPASFLIIFLAFSYRSWHILFHTQLAFTKISFLNGLQTSSITQAIVCTQQQTTALFLGLCGGISSNACSFLWSRLIPCWRISSPKKGMLVHLTRHLSLLSFRFACLHILITSSNIALQSLPSSSIHAIKMSSVILNTFDTPLKSLSIFWNMSLTGAVPNGKHMYLYL